VKLLQVTQPQVGMLASPEQARGELVLEASQQLESPAKRTLKASQLAELRLVSEKPRALANPERPATSRLLASRLGRQALVSFGPVQPQSIPSRD